jgi:hypothetical protein
VGIFVDSASRLRDADSPQKLDRASPSLPLSDRLVRADCFDDLPADPVQGMEARQRVLEDQRDLCAADLAKLLGTRVE